MTDHGLTLFDNADTQASMSAKELNEMTDRIGQQPTKRLPSDDRLSEAHDDATGIRPAWETALTGESPKDRSADTALATGSRRPFEMPSRERSNEITNPTPEQAQRGLSDAEIDSRNAEVKAGVAAAKTILHRELGH